MAINLNENENQNELIPSGTRAMVRMNISPPDQYQKSEISPALTKSKDTDAHYINAMFEVVSGPHTKRKFFQNYTVAGGKVDDQGRSKAGKISGVFLKAAWDAHKNLNPTDMSQAAVQARMVNDYMDFDNIYFPVTIAIRAGNNGYPPKNEIYHVITPDKPEYAKLMAGETVEPMQLGIIGEGKKGAAKPAETKPVWATGAPAAAAPATDAINPAAATGFAQQPPAAPTGQKPVWAR